VTVTDPNSDPNTDAFDVLEGLGDQLRGHGYTVETVDPDPNSPLNALGITEGVRDGPPVSRVPTLSTWGLILLVLALAGTAVLLLRRRPAPLRPAP
jgi:hypothetical protein